jgi:hypothetical protein
VHVYQARRSQLIQAGLVACVCAGRPHRTPQHVSTEHLKTPRRALLAAERDLSKAARTDASYAEKSVPQVIVDRLSIICWKCFLTVLVGTSLRKI